MWAALILAMCAPPSPEVSPPPGLVPPNPTLWVLARRVTPVFLDARGRSLPRTELARSPEVLEVTLAADAGTEFFVQLGTVRLGPWRVSQVPAVMLTAPALEPLEEFESGGCPSAHGWELSSDVRAPMYELELAGASTTSVAWSTGLIVGHAACRPDTWDWRRGDVSVRLRGHFADGSVGAWSEWLELDVPHAPLRTRFVGMLEGNELAVLMLLTLGGSALAAIGGLGLRLTRLRRE
ncbi:MAG: hypothetical protein ACOZQL_14130 [Myxococcota bacterium]